LRTLDELAQEHPTGAPFGCIMTSYTKELQMFYIYQTTNGETKLLYETIDEKVAQNEVERINSYLDSAGIPGWVSSAYYN
jgi:hypothetical protein